MFSGLNGFAWCALAAVASAIATFMIKLSHQTGGEWSALRLTYLGGACASYALGFLCYSIALQKLPMSLAYPLMTAVTMAGVTLIGCLALGELMTFSKIAGLLMITGGAFMLAR